MDKDTLLDGYIVDIVQKHEVREQRDIQELLRQYNQNIPQATLSRRLKKLKVAKVDGIYKIIDFSQQNLPLVLNIQVSEYGLIIMHTHPGQASGLAYFIDQKYVNYSQNGRGGQVLGTIAGDDTLILITKNNKAQNDVLKSLYQDFPYLNLEEE